MPRVMLDLSRFQDSMLPKELREEVSGEHRRVTVDLPSDYPYREQVIPDAQQVGMLKESLRVKHPVYRSSRSPLQVFLDWWYRR